MRFLALILLIVGGLWLLASVISHNDHIKSQTRVFAEPLPVSAQPELVDESVDDRGAMAVTNASFSPSVLISMQ